jgi:hypothetical protein
MIKYCSNRCLNQAFYQRRKFDELQQMNEYLTNDLQNSKNVPVLRLATKEENREENCEPKNKDVMTEETRELLRLTAENGVLQGRISAHSRELQELDRIRKELISVGAQLEIARLKSRSFEEKYEELLDEKENLTNDMEQLQENSDKYESDVGELQNINLILSEENEQLNLANKILCSKGIPNFDGGKIKLVDVKKYLILNDDENQDFSVNVWNWVLEHKAGENILTIRNKKI